VTSKATFQSIWEYEVQEDYQGDFIRAYGSNGLWVKLFSKCHGFIKTDLIQDVDHPNRFVTIDFWQSSSAFSAMKKVIGRQYEELDSNCEAYTVSENHIGFFNGK